MSRNVFIGNPVLTARLSFLFVYSKHKFPDPSSIFCRINKGDTLKAIFGVYRIHLVKILQLCFHTPCERIYARALNFSIIFQSLGNDFL